MVDDPGSVEVIGHPEVNATVATNLRGGGAPSAIPELGPVLTAPRPCSSTTSARDRAGRGDHARPDRKAVRLGQ